MVLFKLKRCTSRMESTQQPYDTDSLKAARGREHKVPLILEEVSTREGKVPISGAGDIVVWVHREI